MNEDERGCTSMNWDERGLKRIKDNDIGRQVMKKMKKDKIC